MDNYQLNRNPWDLNNQPSLIHKPEQIKRRDFYDLVSQMQSYFSCGNDISITAYIGLLNALILLLSEVSLVGGVLDYCRRKNPSNYGKADDSHDELRESLILLRDELRNINKKDSTARYERQQIRCGHPDLTWGRFNADCALKLLRMIAQYGVDETVKSRIKKITAKKGLIGYLSKVWLNPADIFQNDKTPDDVWESATFCFYDLVDTYTQEKADIQTIFENEKFLTENTHTTEQIQNDEDLRKNLQITKEIEVARYNVFIMAKLFKNVQAEYLIRTDFPTEKGFWNSRISALEVRQFDTQNKNFVSNCQAAIDLTNFVNEDYILSGLHWFLITNAVSFDQDYSVWREIKAGKIIEYFEAYDSSRFEVFKDGKVKHSKIESEWKELCEVLITSIKIYKDFKALNPQFMSINLENHTY